MQQSEVVRVLERLAFQAHPLRQLDRKQTPAQAVLDRLPRSQIRRKRQGREQLTRARARTHSRTRLHTIMREFYTADQYNLLFPHDEHDLAVGRVLT